MALKKFVAVKNGVLDVWARFVCALMLVASGGYAYADGEFTDRVASAKAIDTSTLRSSAKTGADNIGFIVGIVGTVVGLVFFVWGVLWVMSASRSEGRKSATAGWVMMIGGGALGAGTALYLLFVGVFAGAAS